MFKFLQSFCLKILGIQHTTWTNFTNMQDCGFWRIRVQWKRNKCRRSGAMVKAAQVRGCKTLLGHRIHRWRTMAYTIVTPTNSLFFTNFILYKYIYANGYNHARLSSYNQCDRCSSFQNPPSFSNLKSSKMIILKVEQWLEHLANFQGKTELETTNYFDITRAEGLVDDATYMRESQKHEPPREPNQLEGFWPK